MKKFLTAAALVGVMMASSDAALAQQGGAQASLSIQLSIQPSCSISSVDNLTQSLSPSGNASLPATISAVCNAPADVLLMSQQGGLAWNCNGSTCLSKFHYTALFTPANGGSTINLDTSATNTACGNYGGGSAAVCATNATNGGAAYTNLTGGSTVTVAPKSGQVAPPSGSYQDTLTVFIAPR